VISVEALSKIIDGFYAKSKIDKALSLLNELRRGEYYSASKLRNYMITCYKIIISELSQEEYDTIKIYIIQQIPKIINERNSRKIAYSLLSQIIEYSCRKGSVEIYNAYEKEILRLADTNKEKYLFHMITLAQTRRRMLSSIESIEDFFIEKYLMPSRIKTINYKYLIDFTMNVDCDRRKFLMHLFRCKPFRNDSIINSFILQHEDLKKLGTLI